MLGRNHYILYKNRGARALIRWLGTNDVHSHFRTAPLRHFFERANVRRDATVVEVGCGPGYNLFLLNDVLGRRDIRYFGFDLNERDISTAEKVRRTLHADHIAFELRDCRQFQFPDGVDFALAIDFLEHIPDPAAILRDIRRLLKSDGLLLISVPTPKFVETFGMDFHKSVGHVHDGIGLDQLSDYLSASGFRVEAHCYNTGRLASALCKLYYRNLRLRHPRIALLSGLGLSLFRRLDIGNSAQSSCSLFVVAKPI